MIGYVEGTIKALRANHCIVLAGSVGYKLFATKETLLRLSADSPVAFWTYLAVREDALDLFGFSEEIDLRFFELLLTVSGIGPKSALGVLDAASVETLRTAIVSANAGYLTGISGIGKKTAEKIILELKDKVGEADGIALASDVEALEAMRALGYSAAESRDALRKVAPEIHDTRDRLREALRLLGSK